MGMNQHTRGTWINNLVYNCHLLVGKISQPGNGPFSLTGQPSACGTVREVGTLTHKLPKGVVMKEGARKLAAKIWDVPVENIDPKPTYHTVEMFRALDRGDIRIRSVGWRQEIGGKCLQPAEDHVSVAVDETRQRETQFRELCVVRPRGAHGNQSEFHNFTSPPVSRTSVTATQTTGNANK